MRVRVASGSPRRVRWTSILVALVAVTCLGGEDVTASQAAGSTGVLVGRVTRGPLSPVGGLPGGREVEPVVRAKVQITGVDRPGSRDTVTDDQGGYRLALPVGTYRVTIGQLRPGEFIKSLPATVTITTGLEMHLDIFIDTGIR
jgi:hypothetical protein